MIKEVKFGIVGTGAIFALSHANAIKKIPNASILSIFDVNQDRALECSQKWQIPKVAKNLDELVKKNQIGMVMLKIIEIIGEDKIQDLDPETIYFLSKILNELKLKKIRNNILIEALPVKA